jgi:PGF-pre-PGF domain-containing protein
MTVNLLDPMQPGTYTLISDTGALPTTLPTLGTNACGYAPVFAWVPGTGLVVTLYPAPTATGISPLSGPANVHTLVNITGTNLDSVSGVTFGSNAATINAKTSTTINMTAPTGSGGPVTVTVTTPGGTATTSYLYTTPVITGAAISGVTVPVTGATPGLTVADNGQYTGTVSWLPADATFKPATLYTATITLTPDTGYTLTGVSANFFTVAGSTSATNTAGSGVVTAAFPSTSATVITTTLPTTAPTPVYYDGSGDSSPSPVISATATPAAPLPPGNISVNVGGSTPITGVTATGTGINDLIVTSTEASGPGTGVSLPPGTVFEYMDITPTRYNTITGAQISFFLPQSWLDDNHLTPQDIVLYHNTGTSWVALTTTLVSEKDGDVYFTATTPGFSRFAITGQAGLSAGSPNAIPSPTVLTMGDPAKESATGSQTTATPSLTPVPTPASTLPVTANTPRAAPDVLPVLGAIALYGLVFLFRKNGN